jgi:sialic acid synthase SpsE
MNSVKIIAEIGWNHLGDMSLAEKMIKSAASCGADFAKFQTWSTENLISGPWDTDGRREIYETAELTKEDHEFLSKTCKENKIKFLTSCFSSSDVDFIRSLTNTVKIPSSEICNEKLLRKVSKAFKEKECEIFISTGACTLNDIQKCMEIMSGLNVTLLHCVSSYPCIAENVNLPRINTLKRFCSRVGYSGHFDGIDDAILSLDYGVSLIEKHFTLDKSLPGRDNMFAILPEDLSRLVSITTNREKMSNYLGDDYLECEEDTITNYRGRWQSE